MSIDLLKLCDRESFYAEFLAEGIYPDGRPINSFTKMSFKRGACGGVGSALVRQGGVTVSCSIKASLTLQHDGPLVIPAIESCSDINQKIVNDILDILNDLFSRNLLFPRESLMSKGSDDAIPLCWQLNLDIRILNSDGCILDAVIGAVVAALSDVRLPWIEVSHLQNDEAPFEKNDIKILEQTSPINYLNFPVAVTFGLYDVQKENGKTCILCDPPTDILNLSRIRCFLVISEQGVLCMRTCGQLSDPVLIQTMIDCAEERRKAVIHTLKTTDS
uniref:Ribosomal RNA-processing protein 43 n=1 Tax=Heterorhabditis bacteriophora TaxID=37862 RepID=A0A1I7XS03_HETBA